MLRRLFLFLICLLVLPVFGHAESLRLDFRGIDKELLKILEAALVLPSSLQEGERLNQRWIKRYQRKLPGLVSGVLEPYGYFHSQTDSELVLEDAGRYRLQIEIAPGEPLHVSSLKLDLEGPGRELAEVQRFAEAFPLRVGDVLRQDLYAAGKTELLQAIRNLGYLDAEFRQHQIKVHRGNRQVDIILLLHTGVRYRFGKTSFANHFTYSERFLRRYLQYQEGEYYSQKLLNQTRLNLLNADLFRSINVQPAPVPGPGNQVPVQIELQPAPRHRLKPGIGYGTDSGARVSLRYRNLNLLERGHELQGDLLLAEKMQSLLSTYIIPDLDRLDSQTLLRIGYEREETDSYLSRKLFSEAEYQRAIGQRLLASLFVRLEQEYSEISDEKTRLQMLLPGVRLVWRQVDAPLAPRRGLQASLELKGAHEKLVSDTSLLQLSAEATSLHPLPRQFSLLFRLQGGTTWQNDPLRQLPASLRYFAGGNRSVRGYRYQALGPRDEQGQVVGGKHLLVANVELEKRFTSDWGGSIFYDIGNAFDSFDEYELEQGIGLGIRRYTRIGPLRLDLAKQLGKKKNKFRLHISVGFGW